MHPIVCYIEIVIQLSDNILTVNKKIYCINIRLLFKVPNIPDSPGHCQTLSLWIYLLMRILISDLTVFSINIFVVFQLFHLNL
jgi:hypothetical protein